MENRPIPPSPKQNLMTKVVRAGAWIYADLTITSVINVGVMAILARQLSPAVFGVVALAQVILRFLVVIGSEGVNQFVIYDNQLGREERIYAAFWMDLFFSSVSAGIGLLLIPLIIKFYSQPDLGPILVVMLLRYPFDSLSKVPDALLKKSLDFQKVTMRDTVLEIFTSLSSIVMALTGFGVWSLVIPLTVASPLRALIVFQIAHWRPQMKFYVRHWPRIFRYTANIIGSSLASYILTDGDTLLVGKLLGSSALGVYNLAWMLANLVPRNITGLTNILALPALSSVSEDLNRMWLGLNRMQSILSIITFPLLVGLFVIADNLILTVYGPQWREAILPLRILIIYALRYAVGSPIGVVYKAIGRPDIGLKLNLAIIPFYLISIGIGSLYGIIGVALGVTFVRTVFGLIGFEVAARCLKVRFVDIIGSMMPALGASCWMAVAVIIGKLLLARYFTENGVIALLMLVGLGGLVYLFLLRTVYHNLAQELASVTAPLVGPMQILVNKTLGIHQA
jgi:O-antigen/teichoic acid export membrane protein